MSGTRKSADRWSTDCARNVAKDSPTEVRDACAYKIGADKPSCRTVDRRGAPRQLHGRDPLHDRNRRDGRQRLYGCDAIRSGEFFPDTRDPGAVRARHFTGEVTAWAGPWPCSAEVPIGTRSPSSHRAAQSPPSSPRSWAVQQATPPTYHAKRPTL